jgi:hypothetical protein
MEKTAEFPYHKNLVFTESNYYCSYQEQLNNKRERKSNFYERILSTQELLEVTIS